MPIDTLPLTGIEWPNLPPEAGNR